jgi:site-specific DNA-methyltransferase (cytosine-N4-specific)
VLRALGAAGGRIATRDLYRRVAEALGVDAATTAELAARGRRGQRIRPFDRSVRWAQQKAKLEGLARPVGDGD